MAHFGTYLRERRTQAGVSLRSLAEALDVSHAYLGGIERGSSRPRKILPRKYWDQLIKLVPTIDVDTLERLAEASRPVAVNVADRSAEVQLAVFALARKVEDRSVSDERLASILAALEEP